MRYLKYLLVIAASLALSACGDNGGGDTTAAAVGTGVISLNGGTGGSGAGGIGGKITTLDITETTALVHGDLKFQTTGTVDASFSVPAIAADFGDNPAIINSDTTVVFRPGAAPLPAADTYFVTDSDFNLHLVNSAGTAETVVTGLTVNAGKTLRIPNDNGHTEFSGAVVVNGTVTNTIGQDGGNLDLQSGSFLHVSAGGKVTTTSAVAGATSGLLNLSSAGVLINQGTVESNGATGGNSGGVTLSAITFLYNTGKVTARGGSNVDPNDLPAGPAGTGGPIQLLSDKASVFTSGTINASGGKGTAGKSAGDITITGGSTGIGRVVVGGPLISNGGDGLGGNGGKGGTIALSSFSGRILVSAAIAANGGEDTGVGNGGDGGALQLNNRLGSDTAAVNEASPEGIKVAGNVSLNGGQGGGLGGAGGELSIVCENAATALPGFADVEFFGYQAIRLNGGDSSDGNGGRGGSVAAVVDSSDIVAVDIPAGRISNAVAISARGGDNNPGKPAKTAGSQGGAGGTLTFKTPQTGGSTDPDRTLVTNTGALDVSGGDGNVGGSQGSVTMSAYGKLTNSAAIRANGGKGTTQGGGVQVVPVPFLVTLSSTKSVVNSGAISVSGGGGTNGNGGNAGGVSLAAGTKVTNSGAIAANGGDGVKTTGTGGNGGIISISSELAFPSNSVVPSVKGGNGNVTGARGTVLINGT